MSAGDQQPQIIEPRADDMADEQFEQEQQEAEDENGQAQETQIQPSITGRPLQAYREDGKPALYVVTHSVSKRHNVGTIARCATAFDATAVCLVGSRAFNSFGAHGADIHVDFRHYATLELCVGALKAAGCEVVGVEIAEGALPVHTHPFTGPTAFLLGNEGQGMTARQMALCDKFVYIPQHGPGTASLNVAVAASLAMHHFALWAGYGERAREGAKFVVAPRPAQRTRARGMAGDPEEIRAQREARRAGAGEAGACGAEVDAEGAALAELLG